MRTLSNPYQSFQYGVRRAIHTHGVSQHTRLARQLKLREGREPGLSHSSSMGNCGVTDESGCRRSSWGDCL
eukprot:2207385-Ditylum_brightwellii.AAC.1